MFFYKPGTEQFDYAKMCRDDLVAWYAGVLLSRFVDEGGKGMRAALHEAMGAAVSMYRDEKERAIEQQLKEAKRNRRKEGMARRAVKENQPCHFCERPTKRRVRFGALTFDVPCCKKCET